MCQFRGQNAPFPLNKVFLAQTIVITIIYLLALLIMQNFKEFLQQIQSYDNALFLDPKWTICPKQFFSEDYYYHSHLPISPFHCAKLKINYSSGSWVTRMCNFWAQNIPFSQIRIFKENQLMSLIPVIYSYLHAKN